MLRIILEREGYEVTDAPNGKWALALLVDAPADLVIIDIIMPVKEGIQTIIELRRDYPDLKIIAISGGGYVSAQQYLVSAVEFGADCTLAKPISRADLLQTVRELLSKTDQEKKAES